jgi:hypothetical protein
MSKVVIGISWDASNKIKMLFSKKFRAEGMLTAIQLRTFTLLASYLISLIIILYYIAS